jgi:DDE superfamily endonuclease
LSGEVLGDCMPRHRHQEFLRFLKRIERSTPRRLVIHLILDNYGTHTHPAVEAWFAAHPRYHRHFTPTGASWLNLVERFLRKSPTSASAEGPSVAWESWYERSVITSADATIALSLLCGLPRLARLRARLNIVTKR